MKKIIKLEQDILNITMKIRNEFPELSKYIKEMPINVAENKKDAINIKSLQTYYNSLAGLLEGYSETHVEAKGKKVEKKTEFPGYPPYPPSEDIYNRGQRETELNPNDLSRHKVTNEEDLGVMNEKGFEEDMSGDDLDVPGSELDDQQESVGSEDEENNYYSLGGDNHNDLDEDNG
jgi:hypothetical protein